MGDVISKIDGVSLPEYVRNELVRYRNLGSDEANLTYHFSTLFDRNANDSPMPEKDGAVLTLIRGEKEVEISLPWIRKDLTVFVAEQAAAAKKEQEKKEKKAEEAPFTGISFGLDGEEPKTLKEIGEMMNLSRERIRQIEAQALDKLNRSQKCQQLRGYLN